MKRISIAILLFLFNLNLIAQTPDATLNFPITVPANGTSVNTGAYNEVLYNNNAASTSGSSYTNCATFTSGNTMRLGSNTAYFEINTPNGKINKVEIRVQSNSTTPGVCIVGFSANGTTWSNFTELAMPANNANPSCLLHTVSAPPNMKYFRICRTYSTVNYPGSTYTPIGALGQTVRIFEVYTYVDALVPTIITSTNALTPFSQISIPSSSQSYTVSGSGLTGASVNLTAPTGYQISTNNSTWNTTLSLPASGGIITGQPRIIYVRLNNNVAGNHSGNITHNSTGATQVDVAVNGTTVITPMLSVNPSALSFGNVYQGSFSAEQFFTVSGIYLTPLNGTVNITAPAGYQISTSSGTGYTSSINLNYVGGVLNLDTIYIRFFPTTNGLYSGNVVVSGGGATTANLAVDGTGTLLSPSAPLTNMGIDFWCGFGYHSRMTSNSGAGAALSLYISAQQPATVRVSIPGIADPSFPKIVNIPANSAVEVTGFPTGSGNVNNTGNGPDARLYFTGVTPRGIHIESLNGVPVAAYEHTYGQDCAGATMLFPTNTWGATYNVLALGGTSNSGIPNSYFFVMAKEDNTQIEITPTADIIDSSSATLFSDNTPVANIKYPSGVPFTITLNKGQIFNAMSRIIGSGSNSALGQDLTGTLIRSTDCENKKIAVWGGNGRTFMNTNGCTITSGSDNLIQQMLPKVAWGTKYLTVPTKTMEYGIYRIYVSSPSAIVKVNGSVLPAASLINNFYYQIETNQPSKIEGDKPITVSQFVVTANCKNATDGNNGTSDPEMIILSPVQQSIKNASVFSAAKLNIIASGGSSYINVILKNGGTAVSSFRIDGLTSVDTGTSSFVAGAAYQSAGTISVANAFKQHPQDANYVYAKFKVNSGTSHNIISDSGFNAIAYGLVNGESYGYNAGTALKDLSAIFQTHNPYDTVPGTKTCRNNPTKLEVAVPYLSNQIDSIRWDLSTNAAVSPNGIIVINTPIPVRTYVQDEITYNVYQMPSNIVFSTPGIYRLYATIFGTFSSECGSSQVVPIDMEVVSDTAQFNFTTAGCGNTLVNFSDNSLPHNNGSVVNWIWNFGDPISGASNTSALQNPSHNFSSVNVYNVTLRAINNIGCYSDTTRIIDLTGGVNAKFTILPKDTICAGSTIVFNDLSTSTGINGPIVKWFWNFGAGGGVVTVLSNASQSFTYNNPGTYTVTLQVETSNGCLSNIMDTNIVVKAVPVANFTSPNETCLNSVVNFTNTSTISSGTITQYVWNFGDPLSGVNNTSNLQNPTHVFSNSGNFTVTLTVTSNDGCTSLPFTKIIVVNQLPTANFTNSAPACANQAITFTNLSVANSGAITHWYWNYGDGILDTLTSGIPHTHVYSNGGNYTVTLIVRTDKGCLSSVFSSNVIINATPNADFILPGNLCLPNANASFTNTTTINDGTIATVTYNWNFGEPSSGANNISTATNPSHTYSGVGPFTVTLISTSANGCSDTISKVVNTIFAQPVASFTNVANACVNSTTSFTSTSTAVGSTITTYNWNFGDPLSGANNTSALQNPTHVFNIPGTYIVSLTVINAQGCPSALFTNTIRIDSLPVASFTVIAPTCEGSSVQFNNTSNPNFVGGTITNSSWNFGDPLSGANNTSTLQNPTHIFNNTGNYTVTLSVTNNNGCISNPIASQVITINPKPFASFNATDICIPNGQANFSNNSNISSGVITQWNWNFGDPISGANNTSTLQNPTHTYLGGGVKTITLTATSAQGCVDDSVKSITVYNTPNAGFTINNVGSLCSNQPVSLTNVSTITGFGTINKIEIFWDYVNNPTISVVDNTPVPNAIYTNSYAPFSVPLTRTFRVLIRATSGVGCTNDFFQDITINAAPQAQLLDFTNVCANAPSITLNQGSDALNLPGIGVYSGPGISVSPVLVPSNAGLGTHTIRYTYTATTGCSSFVEKTITINAVPIVNLGPDRTVIEGDVLTIVPQTLIGNNLTYNWSPNTYFTGVTNVKDAIVKPTADITYNLQVTSAEGCIANDNVFVKVVKDFVVPNTFSPNGDGINDLWKIDYLALYPSIRVQIFNRNGQLLYESNNYNTPWDGMYKGKKLPVDTYYYIIELGGQKKPKTGFVTIIK
jgi:gliding motility-associated-like protein